MTDSNDAEAVLRLQSTLAAIVESSNDAIVSKNLDSIITSWNGAAEHIFGYTAEEAIGQPITLIIPPELRAEEETIIAHIRAGKRVDHFTTERLTKSGRLVNVSITVSPIRDNQGQIIGASKIARDITDQMRNEELFRLATITAGVGLWDVDVPNGIMYWDARTKDMFGFPPEAEVTLDDFYMGVHPDDRDHVAKAYHAALNPDIRALYDVEYRTLSKDSGVIRWVAAKGRGIFDRTGRCIRCLGTTIDITARKDAEQRLVELNGNLEQLVEARSRDLDRIWRFSRDLFVVIDATGTIRSVSPSAKVILGRLPEESIGHSLQAFVWPEDRDNAMDALTRAIKGQELTDFETRLIHADGTPRWLSWRTAREEDLIYAYGRDVTAEKAQAETLRQTETALRQAQKMEAVGQLTGGIAHDFNNMLSVVMGSLDLLNRRIGPEDARSKRYIEAAIDGARRSANLTHRLLAFSRQQPLRPETLNVNKLVAGMSDLLRHSLGADIRLETVLGGGVWPVHADPNQLESVLLNLGVNSRDAMPEGGHLTIETQNAYLDNLYAATNIGVPPGQYVMIAVSDTGTGMPPEVVSKAFDPFFTTKETGKGTGLGLSQVYGFVKQSGGHVKIYSEVGEGTTVKIYLPRAVADTVAEEGSGVSLESLAGEAQETVLVVDDEPAVRQFSVDALTEIGYRVLEAESAMAALRLIEAHPEIDLLFTDIVMPDMNGRKLVDRAMVLRPDLKVLYTTGYTRNAVVHNGVVDKGVELIGKPFSIDDLAAKIRNVLEARAKGGS